MKFVWENALKRPPHNTNAYELNVLRKKTLHNCLRLEIFFCVCVCVFLHTTVNQHSQLTLGPAYEAPCHFTMP